MLSVRKLTARLIPVGYENEQVAKSSNGIWWEF